MLEDREILVVEDDVAIRRLVKKVLLRSGYRVEEAADGIEAVLKLGVREYNVIIRVRGGSFVALCCSA